MCKLDLSNCFWSIRLPAPWRHNFQVYVPGKGGGDQWTRLPFGWAFRPVICQKLVAGIVNGVLSRLQVEGFVYLDDILVVAKKPKVRRGARCVARKLVKVGFLISPKSMCEPTQRSDFVGKRDTGPNQARQPSTSPLNTPICPPCMENTQKHCDEDKWACIHTCKQKNMFVLHDKCATYDVSKMALNVSMHSWSNAATDLANIESP